MVSSDGGDPPCTSSSLVSLMAFMHSQLNRLGKQATSFGAALVIGQRFVIFEITMRSRTTRMHNAFRNSFVVEMEYFFSQYEIFN